MTADLDRHAPRWHVRAPHGWLNDPNGVGRWDGRWHVMYQWNPHAPVWGDIHWGHASSPDLLRWDHEPTALAPRPGTLDGGGAWQETARQLHLHTNTLRYRIARIEELTNRDMSTMSDRVDLFLAMTCLDETD